MARETNIPKVSGTAPRDTRMFGIYRAKCINNQDPRGLGRILVHIYQRDGGLTYQEDIHQWVPVLSPYGGIRGMGLYMIPPIHAEGFVIFEAGLSTNPVWIGTFPYAPLKEVDEAASEAAGYTVIKTTPTVPSELGTDATRVVLKTQYPALGNEVPEDDTNKIENVIVMDETKLELIHVNQNVYEYSPGGITTGTASSFISLRDNSITLGVKAEDGRVFQLQIDNQGIRMVSNTGDQIAVNDGVITLIGSDTAQINIRAMNNGSVVINGKQVVVDGEQVVIGPPGSQGGGGVVTSDCICPFTGMATHTSSSKTIVGG